MVILRGYVRDAEASTDGGEVMVTSAAIIQGSAITYTSSNGTFYTSADVTLDYVTCEAARYRTVDYSVPVFATRYDPLGVISGSLTVNADTTTYSGATIITDTSKIFVSGSLVGRILEMRDGTYDGYTGAINQNTVHTVKLGGGWVTSSGWSARFSHSSVSLLDGTIVLMGGYDSGNKNDVWRSTDNGATWAQLTAGAGWTARYQHTSVAMPDGSIVLMGGADDIGLKNDVWRSTDNGAHWIQQTASAEWTARAYHSSVAMSDGSIALMGGYDDVANLDDVWQSTDNGAHWIQQTGSGGGTSSYVVINAVAGDPYNIGGISGESTTHIEFTMWDNSAYSGQGI